MTLQQLKSLGCQEMKYRVREYKGKTRTIYLNIVAYPQKLCMHMELSDDNGAPSPVLGSYHVENHEYATGEFGYRWVGEGVLKGLQIPIVFTNDSLTQAKVEPTWFKEMMDMHMTYFQDKTL